MNKINFEFLEIIQDPTLIVNDNGQIVGFNSKLQDILGLSMKQLQQRTLSGIISSGLDYLKVLEQISGSEEEISSVDLKTNNEQLIKVKVKSKPFQINDTPYVMISFDKANQIIKRYKEIPEELMSLHNYLYNSTIITRMNSNGMIIAINEMFSESLEYKASEVIGKHHDFLFSNNHTKEFTADIWSTLRRGEIWRGEIKNTKKDGSIFWTDTTMIPTKKDNNNLREYVAIRYDINKKKAVEYNLDLSNNDLDTFIYKTSHDLRAPIATSIGLTNLSKYEDMNDTVKGYFDKIQAELLTLDNILFQLGDSLFLENEPLTVSEVVIDELICDKLKKYQSEYSKHKILVDNRSEETIHTDSGILQIVLEKIFDNAFKFSSQSNTPKVSVEISNKDNGLKISIKNNGLNISVDQFEKIFQPFYKANNDVPGKGLGLYFARLAVNKLNGLIGIEKSRNKDTLMYIWIPDLDRKESTAMDIETSYLKVVGF